eukprot:scaffold242063_cov19-Tisochrysis_lutea.AAC.1
MANWPILLSRTCWTARLSAQDWNQKRLLELFEINYSLPCACERGWCIHTVLHGVVHGSPNDGGLHDLIYAGACRPNGVRHPSPVPGVKVHKCVNQKFLYKNMWAHGASLRPAFRPKTVPDTYMCLQPVCLRPVQENAGPMAFRLPFLQLMIRHLGCPVFAVRLGCASLFNEAQIFPQLLRRSCLVEGVQSGLAIWTGMERERK